MLAAGKGSRIVIEAEGEDAESALAAWFASLPSASGKRSSFQWKWAENPQASGASFTCTAQAFRGIAIGHAHLVSTHAWKSPRIARRSNPAEIERPPSRRAVETRCAWPIAFPRKRLRRAGELRTARLRFSPISTESLTPLPEALGMRRTTAASALSASSPWLR